MTTKPVTMMMEAKAQAQAKAKTKTMMRPDAEKYRRRKSVQFGSVGGPVV